MTYLEMVNKVLRRLREKDVNSVSSTAYSVLIGDLVNDVKSEVELAWNWNSLRYTFKIDTTQGMFNYALQGAQQSSRFINGWNDTNRIRLLQLSTDEAEYRFLNNRDPGAPVAFNFNGTDADGDLQVDVWPIPDTAYRLTFNMYVPQGELVNDGAVIRVPWRPVVEGAIARAIQERGDDGGTGAEIQNIRYKQALTDAIAADAQLHDDEITWTAE